MQENWILVRSDSWWLKVSQHYTCIQAKRKTVTLFWEIFRLLQWGLFILFLACAVVIMDIRFSLHISLYIRQPHVSHLFNNLGKISSTLKMEAPFYFNTCIVHLLLFCTMIKKCTIISQIITLLHVSTLSCRPQGTCNQKLAKLHKCFKFSCW